MEFKFDLNAMRPRVTREAILGSIRAFSILKGGGPFTIEEWKAWPDRVCSAVCVIRRFGSWRGAQELVGIRGGKVWLHPAEKLVAALEDTWREVGHPPGVKLIKARTGIGWKPFARQWGSLARAHELIAAFHAGAITREQLLAPVPRLPRKQRDLGRTVRWRVIERDRHRCVLCGRSPAMELGVELEVDHIVPVCRGGTNEESNLRTLCRECNRGKAGRMDIGDGAGPEHRSRRTDFDGTWETKV
jgi:hypothetical protein